MKFKICTISGSGVKLEIFANKVMRVIFPIKHCPLICPLHFPYTDSTDEKRDSST